MGLLDRIAGYTLTILIQEQIEKHVKDFCTGRYDESHVNNLENVSLYFTLRKRSIHSNFTFSGSTP